MREQRPAPRVAVLGVDDARRLNGCDGRKVNGVGGLVWLVVRGLADGWRGVDAAVAEPVACALEGQDVGVVHDAVDHRGGDDLVAEDGAPAAERQVRRKVSEACS